MKKIAIFGGAFNPPHIMHAAVVEALIRANFLDEIWVMPSGDRIDKNSSGVSKSDRVRMLNIMINELFPSPTIPIMVSELEVNRPTITRTTETKNELEKLYPKERFYFVIGSDILSDIKTKWHNGEELFKSTNFILIPRGLDKLESDIARNIIVLDRSIRSSLSSTFIRNLLSQGYSGTPYISNGVVEYISKNKLYV